MPNSVIPTDSPSTMPPLLRLPRAFHAVSLATTSIVSRTTFVVCVPIASATQPSLQNRDCFAHTLRVTTALSVPHSVADGCVPTTTWSCASVTATSRGWNYAYTFGIALHHHVITSAFAATHRAYPLVTDGHSQSRHTHFRVAHPERRSYCQRSSPRLAVSPARLGASVIRGCSCHIRRTEHQWLKMQTNLGRPQPAADLP